MELLSSTSFLCHGTPSSMSTFWPADAGYGRTSRLLRLVFWCYNLLKQSPLSIEHCRIIYVANRIELAPS